MLHRYNRRGDSSWFPSRIIAAPQTAPRPSASPGGQQAIGRRGAIAQTEVYTFFYGYWRRSEQRQQVGDEVIASIDLSELALPIFQIDQDQNGPMLGGVARTIDAPIIADSGAVILDVRSMMPASRKAEYEVVVRELDGTLGVRQSGHELVSDTRARLEGNWLQGQTAAVGVPGIEERAPAAGAPAGVGDAPRNPGQQQPRNDGGANRGGRGG